MNNRLSLPNLVFRHIAIQSQWRPALRSRCLERALSQSPKCLAQAPVSAGSEEDIIDAWRKCMYVMSLLWQLLCSFGSLYYEQIA